MGITIERLDELYSLWCSETIFPDSEEWRDDLSDEESRIVDVFDRSFMHGVVRLGEDLLTRIIAKNA